MAEPVPDVSGVGEAPRRNGSSRLNEVKGPREPFSPTHVIEAPAAVAAAKAFGGEEGISLDESNSRAVTGEDVEGAPRARTQFEDARSPQIEMQMVKKRFGLAARCAGTALLSTVIVNSRAGGGGG